MVSGGQSQSPYGAKWFATDGYQVPEGWLDLQASQSPYGAKWLATKLLGGDHDGDDAVSQSPYGAKWFATRGRDAGGGPPLLVVAIPLRG